jgi:outer membrane lipoprotein-sorting protein
MLRKAILSNIFLPLAIPLTAAAAAAVPDAPATLSAAQIVDKDVAAKGGLAAWRAVQTMSFSGKMEAGGKQNTPLPVLLELKRPHKTRVEINFQNDKAIQVYDGVKGWKYRPFLGRTDVEAFSPQELEVASVEPELDGPLVDYASKGTKVDLEGVEKVEGRDAYKLKLTLKGGQARRVWVDTQTFLEVKGEGAPRRMDGRMRHVEVYYREYKNVNGLMVPHVLETSVQGVKRSYKMVFETVLVNPKLDDSLFVAPKGK